MPTPGWFDYRGEKGGARKGTAVNVDSTVTELLTTTCQRVWVGRDWRLLTHPELGADPAAFAQRVSDRLGCWQATEGHAEITDRLVEQAVRYEYCRLLHQSVSMDGTAVQERALTEVWNYVTPVIRKYLGADDRALDCANQVLLTIWQKHDQVRDPGTFLSWAAMIAVRAALKALAPAVKSKSVSREEVFSDRRAADDVEDALEVIEELVEQSVLEKEQPMIGSGEIDPAHEVVTKIDQAEQMARFEALIRHCLRRMRVGSEVFIRLVLREETVLEVAARLGLSAANVHLMKFRARDRLRRCHALLHALGRDLASDAEGGAG